MQVDKHVYYVYKKLAKHRMLVHLDTAHRCLRVTVDGIALAKPLSLKNLHAEQMSLFDYLKVLQQEAMSIAHYRERMWLKSGDIAQEVVVTGG